MGFSILKLAEMESEDFSEPPEINADKHHPLWPGIKECLRSVYDPEIPVNIYELGLIYSVRINDNGHDVGVTIDMTLTSPGCPVAQEMPVWVRDAVLELGGYPMSQSILSGNHCGRRQKCPKRQNSKQISIIRLIYNGGGT